MIVERENNYQERETTLKIVKKFQRVLITMKVIDPERDRGLTRLS